MPPAFVPVTERDLGLPTFSRRARNTYGKGRGKRWASATAIAPDEAITEGKDHIQENSTSSDDCSPSDFKSAKIPQVTVSSNQPVISMNAATAGTYKSIHTSSVRAAVPLATANAQIPVEDACKKPSFRDSAHNNRDYLDTFDDVRSTKYAKSSKLSSGDNFDKPFAGSWTSACARNLVKQGGALVDKSNSQTLSKPAVRPVSHSAFPRVRVGLPSNSNSHRLTVFHDSQPNSPRGRDRQPFILKPDVSSKDKYADVFCTQLPGRRLAASSRAPITAECPSASSRFQILSNAELFFEDMPLPFPGNGDDGGLTNQKTRSENSARSTSDSRLSRLGPLQQSLATTNTFELDRSLHDAALYNISAIPKAADITMAEDYEIEDESLVLPNTRPLRVVSLEQGAEARQTRERGAIQRLPRTHAQTRGVFRPVYSAKAAVDRGRKIKRVFDETAIESTDEGVAGPSKGVAAPITVGQPNALVAIASGRFEGGSSCHHPTEPLVPGAELQISPPISDPLVVSRPPRTIRKKQKVSHMMTSPSEDVATLASQLGAQLQVSGRSRISGGTFGRAASAASDSAHPSLGLDSPSPQAPYAVEVAHRAAKAPQRRKRSSASYHRKAVTKATVGPPKRKRDTVPTKVLKEPLHLDEGESSDDPLRI